MKQPPSQGVEEGGGGGGGVATASPGTLSSEYHLFTTFSYNSTSKKLTMIPVKYKIKEERRKVLKISVNKLKKIDDPESWLCRSVLINNTMKKLQKETRDEKVNKQMTYSKNYLPKTTDGDEFGCQLNNNNSNCSNDKIENNNNASSNNNNNNNIGEKVYRVEVNEDKECFYQKEVEAEGEDSVSGSLSEGVPINEDFVEKIPSIKRCASRKKSVDEDGTATEILNLNDTELGMNCDGEKPSGGEMEDVDECDVHDVLSQLYMPPTPRMLTSIDSDTDDDELNVVDIDSSYIDNIKCDKLPNEGLFENGLIASEKRVREEDDEEEEVDVEVEGEIEGGNSAKRRKLDDVFNCFTESYDNFLCSNRNSEKERTSGGETCKDSSRNQEEEQLIELEDEEDIKRRLSQSLSSHYHRKPDKTCDNFFEDSCDNQYSCGHTVTMFSDMQSVTFHNLIASLET